MEMELYALGCLNIFAIWALAYAIWGTYDDATGMAACVLTLTILAFQAVGYIVLALTS